MQVEPHRIVLIALQLQAGFVIVIDPLAQVFDLSVDIIDQSRRAGYQDCAYLFWIHWRYSLSHLSCRSQEPLFLLRRHVRTASQNEKQIVGMSRSCAKVLIIARRVKA